MVRMEKEIQALRTHLQHRHLVPSNVNNDIVDDDEDDGDEDIHKFPNLQMQNEKYIFHKIILSCFKICVAFLFLGRKAEFVCCYLSAYNSTSHSFEKKI